MKLSYGSSRLDIYEPNVFAFIQDLKKNVPIKNNQSLIDLSIGAPNRPTPPWIIQELKDQVGNPQFHSYPPPHGSKELRESIARWYKKRFRVNIDPDRNVLVTIGVKEAIANSILALVNPGNGVLVPDPGYPTYFDGALFAGARLLTYKSDYDEDFVFNEIEEKVRIFKPKVVIVSYPSNPTGRMVTSDFYQKLALLSKKENFIVISDLAYSEITFDSLAAPSYLESMTPEMTGIEYFTFSKTYNMAGWRLGAIVGSESLVSPVKLYKSKIDSNVFYPIQLAGVCALEETPDSYYQELKEMYEERRNILCSGFDDVGLSYSPVQGAIYVWLKTPKDMDSFEFTKELFINTGILVVPGNGYSMEGGDHVRVGLVQEAPLLSEAVQRLKEWLKK
ncbi:MAG: aminotransferase class I/II-fold pyridoxal phosphate-dependent enzyme [Candidatus Atribacteria bacterium]|nr:aminotransferase class I/II-fold pyridoxal phosphate-dependent enzyme [Candidatus Atribacteria bacterium]